MEQGYTELSALPILLFAARHNKFDVTNELDRARQRHEYISKADDDPNTEYKYFFECNVAVAETDEQLDRDDYLGWWYGVAVILLC